MFSSVEAHSDKSERVRLGPALTFLVASLVLTIGIPLAFYVVTPDARDDRWVWSVPVLALSGLRLAWLIGAGERRLFDLTVALFFYFFLGLAPLVQIRVGKFPGTTPDMDPA